jgi:hypothetical protein
VPKLTLRASGIARRRTELGWRAAVLDERESRHAFRLRASEEGSGSLAPASASGASNVQGASGGAFPLRATTTAADSKRDARAAPKLDVENAVVSILQCALDAASLDVTELVR